MTTTAPSSRPSTPLGHGSTSSPSPDEIAPAQCRPLPAVALAASASLGSVLLLWCADSVLSTALTGHGEAALLAWVLTAAAASGALLCGYLAVIWSLAAVALVIGPASRTGRAVVAALHILAPRLAQRITVGAAIAGTATGLVLAPAMAVTVPDDSSGTRVSSASATLGDALPVSPIPAAPLPAELPEGPSAPPEGAEPNTGAGRSPTAVESPELPPLGWSGDPVTTGEQPAAGAPTTPGTPPAAAPAQTGPPEQTAPTEQTAPPERADAAPAVDEPTTVRVRPGDSLWSITDALLGPGTDPAAVIAQEWPLLYEANRDRIGSDPDHLVPGQELIVPAQLSTQEKS